MSSSLTRCLAVVLGALLLSGCTSAPQPAEPEPTPGSAVVEDRPADEVRAASTSLDPCALLPGEVAARLGSGTAPTAQMFSCTIDELAQANTYEWFGTESRADAERFILDGVVAYRSDPSSAWCTISLPTSFETAITFEQHVFGADYDCTIPEAFASAAVAVILDDPASLLRPEDGDGIVACDVFEPVVGEAPEGTAFVHKDLVGGVGLESCALWEDPDPEWGFVAVEPESSLLLVRRSPMPVWSAQGGWEDHEHITIAGRDVLYRPDSDGASCDLFFDAWTSRDDPAQVIGAVVFAQECETARELVAGLVPALESARPVVADVDRLLYAEDEPDLPEG